MADNKKMVEAITSMDTDFAQWYTDVVKKAELCDYASVKGCMVIKPAGYAIWENIQKELDRRFKETGVQNVYMPIFIPESLLEKEKDHVEGFAPEVAWVTHGGLEPLQERLCVRPTSETLFCDFYARDIHSYRDHRVYNQWCSVVRWEKTTRPFLRSREFLWQEGHTAHATAEEAEARTIQMLNVYADFCEQVLAIPVIKGQKTDAIIHSRELTGEGERPCRGLCPRGSMGNSWWIRRAAGASVRKTDLRDSVLRFLRKGYPVLP